MTLLIAKAQGLVTLIEVPLIPVTCGKKSTALPSTLAHSKTHVPEFIDMQALHLKIHASLTNVLVVRIEATIGE